MIWQTIVLAAHKIDTVVGLIIVYMSAVIIMFVNGAFL